VRTKVGRSNSAANNIIQKPGAGTASRSRKFDPAPVACSCP
jgi:hypothetical protein